MRKYNTILMLSAFFVVTLFLVNSSHAQGREQKQYTLSLEDVTRLALANNFDIQLVRYDAMVAETDEGVARSIYDTIFTAEANYSDDQRKKTSAAYGTKTMDNEYNIGISKKLPTGTTIGLDMNNNREWTNATAVTNALNHNSSLEATIEQSLGNNFFGIKDRGGVKITLLDIENSNYTSLETIENLISMVQKAYWDLVLQYELVSVSEDMVAQAKALYDLHQEKLKDGLVEIPEAIASESNYKERKNELMLARNELKAKENILKLMLNVKENNARIKPLDVLGIKGLDVKESTAIKIALENRRDYKKAKNDVKSKEINLSIKKNSLWPEIDLKVTFAKNGLGDNFSQSATGITDEDNSDLFAGLTFSVPLENNKARAQFKAAEIQKAKEILNLKYVERKIAIGIINKVRDSNVFKEVAKNEVEVADLQSQKLKEEEQRFNYGRSDTDTLIRFQEDVIRARESAAVAKFKYMASLIDLEVEEGVLLNKYWEGEL